VPVSQQSVRRWQKTALLGAVFGVVPTPRSGRLSRRPYESRLTFCSMYGSPVLRKSFNQKKIISPLPKFKSLPYRHSQHGFFLLLLPVIPPNPSPPNQLLRLLQHDNLSPAQWHLVTAQQFPPPANSRFHAPAYEAYLISQRLIRVTLSVKSVNILSLNTRMPALQILFPFIRMSAGSDGFTPSCGAPCQ
jgi:hypothetical protein